MVDEKIIIYDPLIKRPVKSLHAAQFSVLLLSAGFFFQIKL